MYLMEDGVNATFAVEEAYAAGVALYDAALGAKLFTDDVTEAGDITIVSVKDAFGDAHGFAIGSGGSQSGAKLITAANQAVRGPTGLLRLIVEGSDEAGNKAQATLFVRIVDDAIREWW
jgi:hypothetical protein